MGRRRVSTAWSGRTLVFIVCVAVASTMAHAQPRDEPTSGLVAALKSVLALFQDLKHAWDENVTFPASKEQLKVRLDKLMRDLAELRTAKADLTEQILAEAQVASASEAELMWEQRDAINRRMRELQNTVRRVQDGLYGLLPLMPANLSRRGSDVVNRLSAGLDEKWIRLEDISHQLTGMTEFVPERIQREGDEAVEITVQLIQAVQQFRVTVAGESA